MRKAISILLSLALTAGILTGCSTGSTSESGSEKLRIVTTIFPEYDWVREILGDRADHVELTMLLDDGVDLHSFQPTADDMVTISNCDLFLYTGGESDSWVEDALANATNPDLVAMNLMEVLGDGVKAEEVVEGMQESEHHHHHEEEENPEDTQSYSLECDGDVIIVVISMMEIRCVDDIFLNICGKSFIKAGEICPKSLVKIFFDVTLQLFR